MNKFYMMIFARFIAWEPYLELMDNEEKQMKCFNAESLRARVEAAKQPIKMPRR